VCTCAICCIQFAKELTDFISDFVELFDSRVTQLKNELERSRQQLAALQQEFNQQHQDHAAQIQQVLEENATLRDSIRTQAAAGALREQQLLDQIGQEQECSSSLSTRLQKSTDSLSLLQSQHDGMVAAGQSLCSVAQAGEARIAHLEECNASLQQERDVLAVMCSALTAQLGSSTAKGAYTAQMPAAEAAASLTAFRPLSQQRECAAPSAEQQQEQFVMAPCSPGRSQELPGACMAESVWGSSSSSPSFSGSCCGGEIEPSEVWSCFDNSAWECC
jgi:DNA repair exonuclease SbcCD ATPase subunit